MEKPKIIFVDIDWTILDHKTHIFDLESINALKECQKNGILVFIATARPYLSVEQTGLFNLIKPDGIVCTNGSVGFIGDELLYSENIPLDIVKDIIRVCNKHNAVVEYCDEKHRYFTRKKNSYVDKYFGVYAETVPPVKKLENENVSALLLMVPKSYDKRLLKELPKCIDYYRFDDYGVDIRYKDFSPHKGNGIDRVLAKLGIDKKFAIGIGDDYGDIPMFKSCGFGITLENGKPEVKEVADYITKSVSESGVAYALKQLNIIK